MDFSLVGTLAFEFKVRKIRSDISLKEFGEVRQKCTQNVFMLINQSINHLFKSGDMAHTNTHTRTHTQTTQ